MLDMLHYRDGIRFSAKAVLYFALITSAATRGQVASVPSPVNPADKIVHKLVESNENRAQALQGYTEDRHYTVEYRGFPGPIAASMDVEATYAAPSSKRFRILSQTGSKLLIDHVLKKLLESETAAAKDPSQTALTPENYSFTLLRTENVSPQTLYVLHVEPRVNRKFLYRGTIWVDAKDFAVTKIEAEPARNPSFWIQSTSVQHVYTKTGDFWLPKQNKSKTKVKLGGTATLSIDYGAYHLGNPQP